MPVRAAAAISSASKSRGRRHSVSKVDSQPVVKLDPNAPIGCFKSQRHDQVAKMFRTLRDKKWFQTSIIIVIFLAGILVGIQTYDIQDPGIISVTETLDEFVMAIFILEIVVKLVAEGNRPFQFFTDAWNVFDFLIVVVGLLPFGGSAVTALRLVRLLRVLKLVRALPKLRILVMGLLRSLSSIAYIGLLLGLLFYLYAVLGVSVFGKNDPVLMGTLHIAFLTLFRCATLEDWTDVMYIAMQGCANYGYDGIEDQCVDSKPQGLMGVLYFCSFVILSSMMILNLFIGVITTSMQEAKTALTEEMESEESLPPDEAMIKRLDKMAIQIEELADEMQEYATIEKQTALNAVVKLSRRDVMSNREIVTSAGTTPTATDARTPHSGRTSKARTDTGDSDNDAHSDDGNSPNAGSDDDSDDDGDSDDGDAGDGAVTPAPSAKPSTQTPPGAGPARFYAGPGSIDAHAQASANDRAPGQLTPLHRAGDAQRPRGGRGQVHTSSPLKTTPPYSSMD